MRFLKSSFDYSVNQIGRVAFLAAQWCRIHLSVQEIGVQSLVWKDPTCHRAAKPVYHKY